MTKFSFCQQDFEIDRYLTASEFQYIVAHINAYKWFMFRLTGRVKLTSERDTGLAIWMKVKNRNAWLTYPQGYEGVLEMPK